ncbi:unnamed protein product, partial [Urochloa humidicola]
MAGSQAKRAEVDESNIVRPDLSKIAADEQKALEEELKKIEEAQAQETERRKEEAKKKFLSHFVQDRHGKIIKEKEISFDTSPPEVQTNGPKVLLRPHQAEKAKGKNVIIGEERAEKKLPIQKTPQAKVKTSTLGGQDKVKKANSANVGLTGPNAGLTATSSRSENIFRFKNKAKLSFEELLAKYKKKGAIQRKKSRPDNSKSAPRYEQGMHQQGANSVFASY